MFGAKMAVLYLRNFWRCNCHMDNRFSNRLYNANTSVQRGQRADDKNSKRVQYLNELFPIESINKNPETLDFCADFNVTTRMSHMKMTKVVCTIGPSTQDVEMLIRLMQVGMDVARLNFSHGTHDYHKQTIDNIREASEQVYGSYEFAIALDTKGPEIRTGKLEGDAKECELETGATIVVTTDPQFQNNITNKLIYIDYPKLCNLLIKESVDNVARYNFC